MEKKELRDSPTTPAIASTREKAAPKRGSRIDPAWWPSEQDQAFAAVEGFAPHEVHRMAEEFVDYWRSRSSQAAKADWSATWRNRIRDIANRRGARRSATPSFTDMALQRAGERD